ncbi:hypothetical protein PsorP6_008892 [Peronosclerospora sorghi]|uniref:Uncharacterized protein n=1 Tax=Peronosclerospora sorghi TaxID=230839 RepID=A0ACC0VZS7_9STRA|nr:hypothetical protein PsorP6_008892 [Peronosclerospora sorghi]
MYTANGGRRRRGNKADAADASGRVMMSSSSPRDGKSLAMESNDARDETITDSPVAPVAPSALLVGQAPMANKTSVRTTNPLLKGSLRPNKSYDHQAKALVSSSEAYIYFNQWKFHELHHKSTVTQLRRAFEQLLPRMVRDMETHNARVCAQLLGGRDYGGAAQVLRVLYHRFPLTMQWCLEASLEILRRQMDDRTGLLRFYEAALQVQRVDKMIILKEMWLFHVVHGEFYEAYYLYQDKIEQVKRLLVEFVAALLTCASFKMEEAEEDARLLANFGILCYWLLFIESKQLRDRFKREEIHFEDEDEENGDLDAMGGGEFGSSEDIELVIESKYSFKTPIGVHILYQHARNALKRAVALSPTSAVFLEYYVQLLVLVGDFQPACDYLESFYHMNPRDPHGPRMVRSKVECCLIRSSLMSLISSPSFSNATIQIQCMLKLRCTPGKSYLFRIQCYFCWWIEIDPSCSIPLEKLLGLSSAGAVSLFQLTKVLVKALDTCGSDLYVEQNPNLALTLWRHLAELLAAVDEDEFLMNQVEEGVTDPMQQETIADVGAQRGWWKGVYFARPYTMQEVVATATRDSVLMEVIIYRAVVSDRLFPGHQTMIEALRSAMNCSNVAFTQEHLRLFRSFFPSHSPLNTTPDNVRQPFSDTPFLHVTDEGRRYKAVPVYRGSSDTIRVIDRASIVKREASTELTEFKVSRSDIKNKVNQQFLDELYEVLKSEVGISSESDWRSRRKREADDRSTPGTPTRIPAFVGMVEDELYRNAKASVHHIYSAIHQKLRRSDLLIPTSKAVAHSVNFFRTRVDNHVELYGHSSLRLRYDEFIARYVRRRRAKGFFQVTKDAAKAALEEMKRVYPCADANFPPEDVVEETMRVKTAMFVRLRRLRLMELKKLLKHVLETIVFVDDKTFVDAVYTVCMQHGLFGILNRVDIARTLQCILPRHYYKVLQKLPPRMIRLLTSPTFRKDCNTSPAILNKLNKVHSSRTAEQVKVLLWVERYEALYGPILDSAEDSAEESHCDNSSSESSADDSSSSSDSSDDRDETRNKEHSDSGDFQPSSSESSNYL